MIKVLHIITGLGVGGAENMLLKILKNTNRNSYEHTVVSLTGKGEISQEIEKLGYEIVNLEIGSFRIFKNLHKVKLLVDKSDLVNTWLYHADFFGFIFSKMRFKTKKIIWNVRHTNLDVQHNKISTLLILKMNRYLSRKIDLVTFNSIESRNNHIKLGFNPQKIKMISNGFDLKEIKFSNINRVKYRNELGIKEDEKVLITVGRWHKQKDYYNLINALKIFKLEIPHFKMIFIGKDLDYENIELSNLIKKSGLENNIVLLGKRLDAKELLSVADLYISSSAGESFSNSIGEALATSLPCVVTDVGESALIIGNAGIVVPSKNSKALANAMSELVHNLTMYNFMKSVAREQIEQRYNIKDVIITIENNYKEVVEYE
ncbi:glycosyltransferase [Exiguobacterium aurantiacum]|uniref:glycosyltransferase n=1 Tax=Exiguobacterium aurantiacum TaxID=33987 RepID=UPI003D03E458